MTACPRCGTIPVDRATAMRRAFALAKKIGLTDAERRELAQMLPTQTGHGPVSWAKLSGPELQQIGDWLHGTQLVAALAFQRSNKPTPKGPTE